MASAIATLDQYIGHESPRLKKSGRGFTLWLDLRWIASANPPCLPTLAAHRDAKMEEEEFIPLTCASRLS
jgi:hypothetical protein